MTNPQMTPAAREAAAAMITAKRDELVAERATLVEQRVELLTRLRQVERALSDCRAAARLFGLSIDFPREDEDEERLVMRRRMEERENQRREEMLATLRRDETAAAAANFDIVRKGDPPRPYLEQPKSSVRLPTKPERPPIRDVVLEQLGVAGIAGAKAATIREYIERTFGDIIHEKTVGMTLYRLAKEGLVRRDGHNWFIVPPKAETVNPGVAAPGLEESLTRKET